MLSNVSHGNINWLNLAIMKIPHASNDMYIDILTLFNTRLRWEKLKTPINRRLAKALMDTHEIGTL